MTALFFIQIKSLFSTWEVERLVLHVLCYIIANENKLERS